MPVIRCPRTTPLACRAGEVHKMKLLYKFLSEKGSIDDYTVITGIIDEMEPHFTKILRKRFG